MDSESAENNGTLNVELTNGEHDVPSPAGQAGDISRQQEPAERGHFYTYRQLAECILAMTPEQQAMRPQVYASFLNDKRLGVVDLIEAGSGSIKNARGKGGGKSSGKADGKSSGMATVDIGDPSDESSESVLVKAREPEDARDFYGYDKWKIERIVGGLPLLCIDTVHNLGVEGFRSCVDNKRNGGDVVLLADMNQFGGDGAYSYEMEFDARTGEFRFHSPEYICGEPTRVEDQLPHVGGDTEDDIEDADHPLG